MIDYEKMTIKQIDKLLKEIEVAKEFLQNLKDEKIKLPD